MVSGEELENEKRWTAFLINLGVNDGLKTLSKPKLLVSKAWTSLMCTMLASFCSYDILSYREI